MNFCTLLNLPPFILFKIYRQIIKGKKYAQDQDKKEKTQKERVLIIFGHIFEPKMVTLKTIHALMYWPKSVPVKEKRREKQKKRDRDSERACGCRKRHANYGPSSPVSIPLLAKTLWRILVGVIGANNPAQVDVAALPPCATTRRSRRHRKL